jgi:hypothetical protein
MDFRAAVISVLGGVGGISPEAYTNALYQIAKLSGRNVDALLLKDVLNVLKTLPCPMD